MDHAEFTTLAIDLAMVNVRQFFLQSLNKPKWHEGQGAEEKGNAIDSIKAVSFKNDGTCRLCHLNPNGALLTGKP